MIRTVAALFAKKTAVVAVSGVVILGGATLALAEVVDEPTTEDPLACVDDPETTEVDECATDPSVPEGEESCDDPETEDVVEECESEVDDSTEDPADEGEAEESDGDSEEAEDDGDESEDEGDDADDDEELNTLDAADDPEGEEDGEETHGQQVSQAARVTCWEEAYLDYYGNHGQCVRTFAHGEGLTLEEVEAALAARDGEETGGEPEASGDPAPQTIEPADEPAPEAVVTESSKPGNGKGNGGAKAAKGNGGGKKGNGKSK